MSIRLLGVVAAIALSTPANAVIVTTTPGAPDPGPAFGQSSVITFDAPSAAGITQTIGGTAGRVITAAGNIGGVRAAPAGTPTGGVYQSIGNGGTNTIDFSGWSRGRPLVSLSFYWGSVDPFNFVDFLGAGGSLVQTVSGSSLPGSSGNQSLGLTNRRVFFDFAPAENIQAIRLRSNGNAFEYDSFAATGTIPEPASWALMLAGFGLVGAAMRRRGQDIVAA